MSFRDALQRAFPAALLLICTHAESQARLRRCRAPAECARASKRIKQVSVDRSIRVREPQELSSERGIESNKEKPKFGTNNANRGTNVVRGLIFEESCQNTQWVRSRILRACRPTRFLQILDNPSLRR